MITPLTLTSSTLQYRSTDFIAPGPGKLQLVYTPENGGEKTTMNVYDFKGPGVAMSMYNTDDVSAVSTGYSYYDPLHASLVNPRLCPFVFQDGSGQEDDSRES